MVLQVHGEHVANVSVSPLHGSLALRMSGLAVIYATFGPLSHKLLDDLVREFLKKEIKHLAGDFRIHLAVVRLQNARSAEDGKDLLKFFCNSDGSLPLESSEHDKLRQMSLVDHQKVVVSVGTRLEIDEVDLAPRVEVLRENGLDDNALLYFCLLELAFSAKGQEETDDFPK